MKNTTIYTAAGVGLCISIIVVWALEAFAGVKVPAEVAAAFGYTASFGLSRFIK